MRSERRHELEQNQLADWMASSIKTVKPYGNAMMGVALAVLIAVVAAVLWAQKVHRETARSWEDFYRAVSTGSYTELDNVVDQYPGSAPADWAAAVAGDLHLAQGCQDLFSSRPKANQELTKAVESYRQVLGETASAALRERATFGLARALESRGELEKAEKSYQQLVDAWPNGPYARVAQARIDDLRRPDTKKFYDRFAKFDPKPALSSEPGIPGERPAFETDALPTGDESMFPPLEPMTLDQTAPAKNKPAETKPAETKPAAPAPKEETSKEPKK